MLDHSEQGTAPGLVDGLRELGDLAGGEGAEPAGEAPPEAEADDDQPPAQAEVLLELQPRDLERVRRVQREPLVGGRGSDGHEVRRGDIQLAAAASVCAWLTC